MREWMTVFACTSSRSVEQACKGGWVCLTDSQLGVADVMKLKVLASIASQSYHVRPHPTSKAARDAGSLVYPL